ncbi:MAG: hypothetical protein Q9162_007160 [Coniocarpon cinnabarinum]
MPARLNTFTLTYTTYDYVYPHVADVITASTYQATTTVAAPLQSTGSEQLLTLTYTTSYVSWAADDSGEQEVVNTVKWFTAVPLSTATVFVSPDDGGTTTLSATSASSVSATSDSGDETTSKTPSLTSADPPQTSSSSSPSTQINLSNPKSTSPSGSFITATSETSSSALGSSPSDSGNTGSTTSAQHTISSSLSSLSPVAASGPTPSNSSPNSSSNSHDGLSSGAIAGIAIGGAIALILVLSLAAYIFRMRRRVNELDRRVSATNGAATPFEKVELPAQEQGWWARTFGGRASELPAREEVRPRVELEGSGVVARSVSFGKNSER